MTSLEPTRMTTPQFISPEELEDDTACAVLSALTGEWRTTGFGKYIHRSGGDNEIFLF